MVFKMKIIKEELQFEEGLKQRLEFICEFAKVTPTFINGRIIHTFLLMNLEIQDFTIEKESGLLGMRMVPLKYFLWVL